jgi:hypothetical protein
MKSQFNAFKYATFLTLIYSLVANQAFCQSLEISKNVPPSVAQIITQAFNKSKKDHSLNQYASKAKIMVRTANSKGVMAIIYEYPIKGVSVLFDDSLGFTFSPYAPDLGKLAYNLEFILTRAQAIASDSKKINELEYLNSFTVYMQLQKSKIKTNLIFEMTCNFLDVRLLGNIYYQAPGNVFENIGYFQSLSIKFENPLSNPYVNKALAFLGYKKR